MLLIILVQGFCPLRIKITHFLVDSVLISQRLEHCDWLINNQNLMNQSGAATRVQSSHGQRSASVMRVSSVNMFL